MTDFANMVSEHIPNLRRYARVLVRDSIHAEDLVQDCLERAISREHLWQPGTNLRAWLFTIQHNLYINQYLRRGGTTTLVPLLEEHSMVSSPPRQFHSMTLQDLARAFDGLPRQEQQVVLLVGLEGMQYEDAAQTLGVPMGTVKSRLSRARRRLRKLMDGELRMPPRTGKPVRGAIEAMPKDTTKRPSPPTAEGARG
ncbi:MAG TPA: sigma-70 family RNA polymerase sigma factor [Patescibacteria group bacterium]|nr:sigma-70 family RNA polymerase sigma factor [Patescibacteria group bacterium]